ncbi:hypothetical protein [Corynebacterium sp.]|uniref:hypothetical protein n=1 Tax=Corynebacterium sp. TaxID=1720 RepID=UPI0025BFDD7D|nr:hypothetical protein [Corynebacterium sp.]
MTDEDQGIKGTIPARNISLAVALVGLLLAIIALLTGSASSDLAKAGFAIAVIGWAGFFVVTPRKRK